jgi:nucleoside-diphosphate-sugar epimerase
MVRQRICVTGATGFLGAALARALVEQGSCMQGLVRPGANRNALAGSNINWHEGDITDPGTLDSFLSGAHAIIHSAGLLGRAGISEQEYFRVNAEGVRNLTTAALKTAPQARVVHISTAGVLGPSSELPDETADPAPDNVYEKSKAAGERFALQSARAGLNVVIARPGFLYGPGDRHVLGLFQAIQRRRFFLIDGGLHLCHPTFIADAVVGILLCLERGRSGEIYNITGPAPVTFSGFAGNIASALGVTPPFVNLPNWAAYPAAALLEQLFLFTGKTPPLSRSGVDFFSQSRTASWHKAAIELGFQPRYDVATGVGATVAWYREQGWIA